MATQLPQSTRVRNIAEQALIGENHPDPLRQASTMRANLIERALLNPRLGQIPRQAPPVPLLADAQGPGAAAGTGPGSERRS